MYEDLYALLGDELDSYLKRTERSSVLFKKAVEVLPEGIGGSAAPYKPYPIYMRKAEGSRIWDVDDNEYVDFNLCWGVLMVGHSHPKLVAALKEALSCGTMFGFAHESSEKLARELCRRFPMDGVRFVNSGTEANMFAVRLARAFTDKSKIVKIEGSYHGWASELFISKRPPVGKAGPPSKPTPVTHGKGIPSGIVKDTLIAPFNNIQAMENILREYAGEVAAVIVEPVMMNAGVIPPRENYLNELRALTEEYNVLLIFDEVKTGVKIAPGGASEYYRVEPDIICLAKAMGGGLPIGACGAKKEIMDQIESGDVPLYGTYSANPLAVIASLTTLTQILTDDAYSKIEQLGNELMNGYREIVEDKKLKAKIQGVASIGCILFSEHEVSDYRGFARVDRDKWRKYWFSMVNRGVIPMPYGHEEEWTISVQHEKEDIELHLEVFKEVAAKL